MTSRPILPAIAALGLFAATAAADDFSYEVGLDYASSETETVLSFDGLAFPSLQPLPQSVTLNSEEDNVRLSGTWYFEGLSDARGPRSQLAFVDRASSLSLSYSDGTIELPAPVGIFNPPAPIPTTDIDTQSFDAAARYVWQDSGWFITAALSFSEISAFGDDLDGTAISAGVGKYLGETTTLELQLLRTEVDSGFGSDNDTGVALTARHIGDLGETWQYGIRASASDQAPGGGSGAYDVGFSLYPNRDVSLGLGISGPLGADDPFDATLFSLTAGWFATPNLSVSAGYNWADVDEPPRQDIDQSGFSLGVGYRF